MNFRARACFIFTLRSMIKNVNKSFPFSSPYYSNASSYYNCSAMSTKTRTVLKRIWLWLQAFSNIHLNVFMIINRVMLFSKLLYDCDMN